MIEHSLHSVLICDIHTAIYPLDCSRTAVCPCTLFRVPCCPHSEGCGRQSLNTFKFGLQISNVCYIQKWCVKTVKKKKVVVVKVIKKNLNLIFLFFFCLKKKKCLRQCPFTQLVHDVDKVSRIQKILDRNTKIFV